jgi:hypothetical protein
LNRTLTRTLLMAGSVLFALMPLYLTPAKDRVYDGGFLILAVAFLADAFFRCLGAENDKRTWKVVLGVGSSVLLAVSLLQFGPIANDLRREKTALTESLSRNEIGPLARFEKERDEDERNLPNSSMLLLLSGILAEFSVILFVEN